MYFFIKVQWSILSNVFFISLNTPIVLFILSIAVYQLSVMYMLMHRTKIMGYENWKEPRRAPDSSPGGQIHRKHARKRGKFAANMTME